MPYANADGVKLYYEEQGEGVPVVFVHEFAGDHRSWEPQMRYFARRYRCVAYNARGYPPSDVPADVEAYSQAIATDDIAAVMRHLDIQKAHVVGLSMGSFAALHFGLRYPEMARSLVVAGGGYGALPINHDKFQEEARLMADKIEQEGMETVTQAYAVGSGRVSFKEKDPRGWQEFADQLAEHSTQGSALTMRGYQARRPAFTEVEEGLRKMTVPTLVIAGDEDEPGLEPSVYLKRNIPSAALLVMPKTGHAMNLEEPARFNDAVQDFFSTVECGRWRSRELPDEEGTILKSG